MTQFETRKQRNIGPSSAVIDLSEFDLDDLAAEIARTLVACDALVEVSSTRANGKEKGNPR